MRPEYEDDARMAEDYLREHARPGQPAPLMLDADEPDDPERWRAIVEWLVAERGWTTNVDGRLGLWFYLPGDPLAPLDDVARQLN